MAGVDSNPAKRRRKGKNVPPEEKEAERLDAERNAAEAARLEKELFGGTEEDFDAFGREERVEDTPYEGVLGFEDRWGAKGDADEDERAGPRPAWVDEEDDEVTVNIARVNRLRKLRTEEEEAVLTGAQYAERLRAQHVKLNRGTEWARLETRGKRRLLHEGGWEEEGEEEERGEILREAGDLVVRSRTKLPQTVLEATRMRDANQEEPTKGVVRSVCFHPNAQLLLTAGLDKTVRFFNVDGKKNPRVQSLFLEDMPVAKAAFTGDGRKVVAAGRRKWFYVVDLASARVERIGGIVGREEKSLESFALSPLGDQAAFLGNEGHVSLVSLHSKQCIGTLKMNGSARAAAYAPDGNTLLTSGGDGEVYHWDVRTRRCLYRTRDEGCVKSSAIDVSMDGRYFATGSDSGVVNVYNGGRLGADDEPVNEPRGLFSTSPSPLKTIMNLTTVADTVRFNPDGQILAIASRMKKDSLRLVHLPSGTVFQNWPTARSPLQFVHSLDFSPGGGFMAVGNAKGKVLLYRLHHYEHA